MLMLHCNILNMFVSLIPIAIMIKHVMMAGNYVNITHSNEYIADSVSLCGANGECVDSRTGYPRFNPLHMLLLLLYLKTECN